MARTVTGIDIGSRTNKFVRGQYKGNTFALARFGVVAHGESEVADAWGAGAAPFKLGESRILSLLVFSQSLAPSRPCSPTCL